MVLEAVVSRSLSLYVAYISVASEPLPFDSARSQSVSVHDESQSPALASLCFVFIFQSLFNGLHVDENFTSHDG